MKDLSEQIEELRHTLRPSTELANERVTSLELQIEADFDFLRKRILEVTQKAREFQSEVHSDLVELAAVFGILPSANVAQPPLSNGHDKYSRATQVADGIMGQLQ